MDDCCKVCRNLRKLMALKIVKYFCVGLLATLADWTTFYFFFYVLLVSWKLSFIPAFIAGFLTNYIFNKLFTFKCKSKKIAKQMVVHASLSIVGVFLSFGVMYILIDLLGMHEMLSKIITTFIIFGVNFMLHSKITFNERFFR